MDLHFDIPKGLSSIIKVIGVGGGGGNAVNHMFQQGIKGVDFMICNTDAQALEKSPIPIKVHLGNNLTEGRGAGGDPEVGRKAAIESIEEIKRVLGHQTKMVFITAGMGGGTGTGAAPVIAKVAKEMGILTVGIVTSPFGFEGPKRFERAAEGLDNLKKNVDTILIIKNEKLRELFGNFPFSAAFAQSDNILTTAAKGIAEIITQSGYINVDFEDVKTAMAGAGAAILGCGMAEGEERAAKAVENALDSPLLSDSDIQGARHILLNITSGTKEILMDEIGIITTYIREAAGENADLKFGHCYDETIGERIVVTLIATGFDAKPANQLKEEKKIMPLEDDTDTKQDAPIPMQAQLWPAERGEPELKKTTANADIEEQKLRRLKQEHDTLQTTRGLDDLEKQPAFVRKGIRLKNVPHSSETNISRYTLSEDTEDGNSIKPKNSFLHDNVD